MTDTTEAAPTATIHHLPPMRRRIPTEIQRGQMEPFAEVLRKMPDTNFSLAFEIMIDEVRRRRLHGLVAGAAHDLALEGMSAGDLEALARALDAANGLGGVA
jgi:hypothetical protein